MSDHVVEPASLADLRGRAASRLAGAAAGKGSPARITDALSALYTLASSPATAADALALLHELQVHQVELELQAQELQESRAEMESALRQQMERYDSQPVGCFTLDERLVVHDMNKTGAVMLGVDRDDQPGIHLGAFFSADSKRTLEKLVARAFAGEGHLSQALQLCRGTDPARAVHVNLRWGVGAQRCFVVLADRPDEQNSRATGV